MARPHKTISDFDRKLGIAIKNRRTDPEYGMSQKKLAKATGIPLSNLQRREDGDNEMTVSELERVAFALRTTPLALVQDALARYGGLSKLIAEYGPGDQMSGDAPTVPDDGPITTADNVTYIGRVAAPLDAAADDDPRTPPKE